MVDSLPNVPGHKFHYSADGSVFGWWRSSQPDAFEVRNAEGALLADGNVGTSWNIGGQTASTTYNFVIVFPEERDLMGYHCQVARGNQWNGLSVAVSRDTTIGNDGTWTAILAVEDTNVNANSTGPRTNIQAVTEPGIKAIRFAWSRTSSTSPGNLVLYNFSLYGVIPNGQNDQRLGIWHPTLDQHVGPAHFDYGDTLLGEASVAQFRLKNMHPDLTAIAPTVAVEDYSGSGLGDALRLSADGGSTWTQSLSFPDMAPGDFSPTITARLITPLTSVVGRPYSARLRSSASAWV